MDHRAGNVIIAARNKKGWDQQKLARETGLKGTTISRYENNKAPITWEKAELLAQTLGINMEYMVMLSFCDWGINDKLRGVYEKYPRIKRLINMFDSVVGDCLDDMEQENRENQRNHLSVVNIDKKGKT